MSSATIRGTITFRRVILTHYASAYAPFQQCLMTNAPINELRTAQGSWSMMMGRMAIAYKPILTAFTCTDHKMRKSTCWYPKASER